VYLDAECTQHVTVSVGERTVAGEVVAFAKGKGALAKAVTPKEVLDGGWALWEVWRSLGIGASLFPCFLAFFCSPKLTRFSLSSRRTSCSRVRIR
jgi:hypothetical protein